jgi:histidinol-phosphate aminotransferase
MTLAPKPGVLDVPAYIGGRAKADGAERVFKLSSNESPFGPSPKALEAYHAAGAKIGLYPEGSAAILRDALAEHYGLEPGQIICGNGSDELLRLLAESYLRPKDEVLFSEYGFLVYKIAALANSATPVEVPETETNHGLELRVDALLERVSGRTRMVFIANPNNPTGSYISASELRRLHAGLPASALLVLDAAYAEYVWHNDYDAGVRLVREADNVVMTRTFSKVYGLPGLRVGWMYGPKHIADTLNRMRNPFNVNGPAQAAAVAALGDIAFTDRAVDHNRKWLPWLTGEIRKLGLRVDDSAANFVLIHFTDEPGKRAADADRFLTSRGLILRGLTAYGLPHCLRLTVGTEEANRLVVHALAEFLGAA